MNGQSDLQLTIGYWIVSHKDQLRTWWALTLLGFIAFSLVWTIGFTVTFFVQQPRTDRLVASAAREVTALRSAAGSAPAPLQSTAATVFARGGKSVDLLATISNPNEEWGASSVTVHFALGGRSLLSQTLFVNPAESRPVIAVNVPTAAPAGEASLVIDRVDWQRAGAAALPPADFIVSDLTVRPSTVATGQLTTMSLKATIFNRSVYNFYRVVVPVVLKAGEQPVAVDEVVFDRWPTLSTKSIALHWTGVTTASGADIRPQVSRFDTDNVYR